MEVVIPVNLLSPVNSSEKAIVRNWIRCYGMMMMKQKWQTGGSCIILSLCFIYLVFNKHFQNFIRHESYFAYKKEFYIFSLYCFIWNKFNRQKYLCYSCIFQFFFSLMAPFCNDFIFINLPLSNHSPSFVMV